MHIASENNELTKLAWLLAADVNKNTLNPDHDRRFEVIDGKLGYETYGTNYTHVDAGDQECSAEANVLSNKYHLGEPFIVPAAHNRSGSQSYTVTFPNIDIAEARKAILEQFAEHATGRMSWLATVLPPEEMAEFITGQVIPKIQSKYTDTEQLTFAQKLGSEIGLGFNAAQRVRG